MGTWNSRGLRGSTLEDMINRTNERYLEKGLALIQKFRRQSLLFGLIRSIVISRWHILIREVLLTTLGRYRGFRYALMRRNVIQTRFRCKIFMNIR